MMWVCRINSPSLRLTLVIRSMMWTPSMLTATRQNFGKVLEAFCYNKQKCACYWVQLSVSNPRVTVGDIYQPPYIWEFFCCRGSHLRRSPSTGQQRNMFTDVKTTTTHVHRCEDNNSKGWTPGVLHITWQMFYCLFAFCGTDLHLEEDGAVRRPRADDLKEAQTSLVLTHTTWPVVVFLYYL